MAIINVDGPGQLRNSASDADACAHGDRCTGLRCCRELQVSDPGFQAHAQETSQRMAEASEEASELSSQMTCFNNRLR